MRIDSLFENRTVLSYEVFPPKPTSPVDSIYRTIGELKELSPDFISVTYGAGGGKNNQESFNIARAIEENGVPCVAHLPCITMSRQDVVKRLDELTALGVKNVLALRGDMPTDGSAVRGDFKYASELVSFIKEHGDFHVIGACYPEGHVEAKDKVEDIRNLKIKVDAGVDHLITQLFFDNDYFYSFMERCRIAGIDVPVEAGIMPVTNKRQIERMTSLCGATVPKKFAAMMDKYDGNPLAMRDAGIAYAVDQIVDLISQGVDGIHLYTMNNPYIARKIHEAVASLL